MEMEEEARHYIEVFYNYNPDVEIKMILHIFMLLLIGTHYYI